MYSALDQSTVPALVQRAVAAALELEFELCVHPATGRLLQSLAAGVALGGVVAETGTGTGAGLAWMASFAEPGVSFISVELDEDRAAAAQAVFVDVPNVTVIHGDAGLIYEQGPFDLLVFDGGWGTGKTGGPVVELADVVKPYGSLTIDDFAPMREFPPVFKGQVDAGRHYWLTHPDVLATEIQVAPEMSVLVARHTPRKKKNP
jgi:predicted O-methyltransferase YrrM